MDDPTLSDRPAPPAQSSRRQSRYIRAQERRDAQRRADQRFYNAIFGVIGACVLVVLVLAMVGTLQSGEGGASGNAEDISYSTFLGLSAIQWGGLVIVGIIAIFMWRRITKR